jgi:hypothetical protein
MSTFVDRSYRDPIVPPGYVDESPWLVKCEVILSQKFIPLIYSILGAIQYDPHRYPTPKQAFWVDHYYHLLVELAPPVFEGEEPDDGSSPPACPGSLK